VHRSALSQEILGPFRDGMVIPAHPLALNSACQLDVRRQRALSRYYIDAGAGGLAAIRILILIVALHPDGPFQCS